MPNISAFVIYFYLQKAHILRSDRAFLQKWQHHLQRLTVCIHHVVELQVKFGGKGRSIATIMWLSTWNMLSLEANLTHIMKEQQLGPSPGQPVQSLSSATTPSLVSVGIGLIHCPLFLVCSRAGGTKRFH
jgi:hypothetical protein